MKLYVDIEKNMGTFNLKVKFEHKIGILGFLGESGSGKSMTLKCIAGLEKPDYGKIILGNKVLFDSVNNINLSVKERNIGFIFQNYALFPHMNIEQNISLGIKNIKKAEKEKLINLYLNKFGLQGLEKRYPWQLSGGQAQRVAIARALATKPDIILLDEPFSALDHNLRKNIEIELVEILKEYNGKIILVTHDIEEAYRICEDISVYDNGVSMEMRNSKDLFKNPKSLIEAKTTGCENISKIKKEDIKNIIAIDWSYQYEDFITEDFKYVGIRSKDIQIVSENMGKKNNFKVKNIIENIYTYTIYLNKEEGKIIKVDINKEKLDFSKGDIVEVKIDIQKLFYFN